MQNHRDRDRLRLRAGSGSFATTPPTLIWIYCPFSRCSFLTNSSSWMIIFTNAFPLWTDVPSFIGMYTSSTFPNLLRQPCRSSSLALRGMLVTNRSSYSYLYTLLGYWVVCGAGCSVEGRLSGSSSSSSDIQANSFCFFMGPVYFVCLFSVCYSSGSSAASPMGILNNSGGISQSLICSSHFFRCYCCFFIGSQSYSSRANYYLIVMLYFSRYLLSGATKSRAGSVYTWGTSVQSIGRSEKDKSRPKKLEGFDGKVTKVCMGPAHSALVTSNGELYTFGQGQHGQLGHNDGGKSHTQPKLLDFFYKNNLKVVDVACGEKHTAVLTHDGDVWTFGWGGRKLNAFLQIFYSSTGPLGHGDSKTHHAPVPVEELRKHAKAVSVSAGRSFTNILNKKNEIYNWGRGEYGAFGNGENSNFQKPQLNDYFQHLRKDENLTVKKLKSCGSYSVALMSDDRLYGWGANESGQIGVESEIGVEMYETCNFATLIEPEGLKNQKVVDFELGENVLVLKLDNGEVWWSGMKLVYRPERLPIDSTNKPDLIGACRFGIAVVTGQKVQMKWEFFPTNKQDVKTAIYTTTVPQLFGKEGEVLAIGGAYNNQYAILEEK